jgi:hypothetical protein
VAGPPLPVSPQMPVPATVVMMPVAAETLRTAQLLVSAMNRLPERSTAIPVGKSSLALLAGPWSPVYPVAPVPAIVVMMPCGSTLRLTLLSTPAGHGWTTGQ